MSVMTVTTRHEGEATSTSVTFSSDNITEHDVFGYSISSMSDFMI
jgi:hypothetical protein